MVELALEVGEVLFKTQLQACDLTFCLFNTVVWGTFRLILAGYKNLSHFTSCHVLGAMQLTLIFLLKMLYVSALSEMKNQAKKGLNSPHFHGSQTPLSGLIVCCWPLVPLAGPNASFSRGFPLRRLTMTNLLSIGTNCSHGILHLLFM